MVFELVADERRWGKPTPTYEVKLEKPVTVEEFVNAVVENGFSRWGWFCVEKLSASGILGEYSGKAFAMADKEAYDAVKGKTLKSLRAVGDRMVMHFYAMIFED